MRRERCKLKLISEWKWWNMVNGNIEYGESGEDPNNFSCPSRLGSLVPEEPTNTTLVGASEWRWLQIIAGKKIPTSIQQRESSIQYRTAPTGWHHTANCPHVMTRLVCVLQREHPVKRSSARGQAPAAATAQFQVAVVACPEQTNTNIAQTTCSKHQQTIKEIKAAEVLAKPRWFRFYSLFSLSPFFLSRTFRLFAV